MNPLDPWTQSTSTVTAERSGSERVARVSDHMVKVSSETYKSVMFMSCAERKEFVQDRRRNEDKPQKRTAEGVPLWSVQVAAINWRDKSDLLTVTVPMHGNPGEKFRAGDAVSFDGLVFGVTAKRDGGGFVRWYSADDVQPVSSGAQLKAAAAS